MGDFLFLTQASLRTNAPFNLEHTLSLKPKQDRGCTMLISYLGNLSGLVSRAAPVKPRIFRDDSGKPSRWLPVFDRMILGAGPGRAFCRR